MTNSAKREPGVSLRRRMIVHTSLMICGALFIGLTAMMGINGVHQQLGLAMQGYRQLRQVYEVGFHVASARQALDRVPRDDAEAKAEIGAAEVKLRESDYDGGFAAAAPSWMDESRRRDLDEALLKAQRQFRTPIDTPASLEARRATLAALLGKLATLSSDIRVEVTSRQAEADCERRIALALSGGLIAVIGGSLIAVGVRQYRRVMKPLERLRAGVRAFATGKFNQRIETSGDLEFVSLARDFNKMAAELQQFYRELETQVRVKSQELVKSERLASVGFLAAGVAHEINNPLGVISGYGERSLRQLERAGDGQALQSAQQAIRIMCDEAFRCKQITGRLLSLARPESTERAPVDLAELAREVVQAVGSLPKYAQRQIELASVPAGMDRVVASRGEIKQVIMNLLINALEAVRENGGAVWIDFRAGDESVELTVADNGRGMSAQTLERIFEPFFTEKRSGGPGTGLGLSISHAILREHGGTISAHSEGIGKGSRFTISLPAVARAQPAVAYA